MRKIASGFFLVVLAVAALTAAPVWGQADAIRLARVDVDLWPDFDRASVLVLISAELPPGTPLPARVVVPVPDGASLNAVARITPEGNMFDDLSYEGGNAGRPLVVETTEERFRVEYYVPYVSDGTRRQVTYDWTASIPVSAFSLIVQEPAAATSLTVAPAAERVDTRPDGLRYHVLTEVALAAGETFAVELDYTLSGSVLTVDLLDPLDSAESNPAPATPLSASDGPNWSLIAAGGLLALAVIVLAIVLIRTRTPAAKRLSKPARRRAAPPRTAAPPPASGSAQFCPQCGQPITAADKFCRSCGHKLT
jgi:hypothetical protein